MPALVFPPPGAPTATNFSTTKFGGFDMAPVTKSSIKNLLRFSENFYGSAWELGSYFPSSYSPVTDYLYDQDILLSNVYLVQTSLSRKTSYLTVKWYQDDLDILENTLTNPPGVTSILTTINSNSAAQYVRQTVDVTASTTYTFSFYSKKGSAADNRYKIVDTLTGQNIVAPTSYTSLLSSTAWTRITVTFTVGPNTTSITVYPLTDIASAPGSNFITGLQLEPGYIANTYTATDYSTYTSSEIATSRAIGTLKYINKVKLPLSYSSSIPKLSSAIKVKSPARNNNIVDRAEILKIPNNKTGSFFTPSLNKIAAAVKTIGMLSDARLSSVPRISSASKLKGPGRNLSQDNISQYKVSKIPAIVMQSTIPVVKSSARLTSDPARIATTVLKSGISIKGTIADARLRNTNRTEQIKIPAVATANPVFSTLPTINTADLTQGSVYNITGQSVGITTNSILYHLYDQDILTVTKNQVNTLTFYFDNLNYSASLPFIAGSTIKISNTVDQGYSFVATVISSNINSVTIEKFSEYDTTMIFNTIVSTAVDYIPRLSVRTSIRPVNPRERLFYSEMGVGGPNLTISRGIIVADHDNRLLQGNLPLELFKLRADNNTLTASKLESSAVLKADKTILLSNSLKSASVIRGVRTPAFDTDSITAFKVSYKNTQVFVAPKSSSMSLELFDLVGDKTVLTSALIKSSAKLTGDRNRLLSNSLVNPLFVLQGDRVQLFDIDYIDLLKLYANRTAVFNAPNTSVLQKNIADLYETPYRVSVNKLTSNAVLRSDNTVISVNKLTSNAVLKDTKSITLDTDRLEILKVRNSRILYTPTVGKTDAVSVLRGDRSTVVYSTLQQPITILKTDDNILYTDMLNKYTVNDINALEIPISGKLRDMTTLRSDRTVIETSKLTASTKVKSDAVKINAENINLFKVPANNTEIFYVPYSDKLSSASVLRAEPSRVITGRVKSSAKLTAVSSVIRTDGLKKLFTLTTVRPLYNIDRLDDLYEQSLVRPTLPPVNPRERLFYSVMAGGYRNNSSIQKGILFADETFVDATNRLEQFNNIGITQGPAYTVNGYDIGLRGNTVLEYLFDLDILTVSKVSTSALDLYIDDTGTPPFVVGSYVTISNNGSVYSTQQVVACSSNIVSIVKPEYWDDLNIIDSVISATLDFVPQIQVRPTGHPTNPRERLFYAVLLGKIQTDKSFISTVNNSTTGLLTDFIKIREARIRHTSGSVVLRAKPIDFYAQNISNIVGKILPQSGIRGLGNRYTNRLEIVSKFTTNKEHTAVLFTADAGQIVRLKTGKYGTGIADISVKKKDPIQFWN
jgi:hypothetical protein